VNVTDDVNTMSASTVILACSQSARHIGSRTCRVEYIGCKFHRQDEKMSETDANGFAPSTPPDTDPLAALECTHVSHRTLRLFLSYAEANAVRVSFKSGLRSERVAVSPLRRIEGGWSFTMCERCLASDGTSADMSA
jgi:hypothetical protein